MKIDMLDMWYLEVYPFDGNTNCHIAAYEEDTAWVDIVLQDTTYTPTQADEIANGIAVAANIARVVSGEKPELAQTNRERAFYALVSKIEWVSHSGREEDSVCPVCGGSKLYSGHAPECVLAGMLRHESADAFFACMKESPTDALCFEYENRNRKQDDPAQK